MTWIFGLFLVTPCALANCHILSSKLKDDGTSGHLGRTGGMRTTRSDLDRVQRIAVERGTRSWSEVYRLARGCKRCHPLVSGRRYVKKSSISEYMSLQPSLTYHRSINPFENKAWEIYFYKGVGSFVHWGSYIMFDYISTYICITAIQQFVLRICIWNYCLPTLIASYLKR